MPVVERYAKLLGDIGESAVVIVAIEAAGAVVADVYVGPPVVVVVGHRAAVAPAVILDAGFFRDVGESAVVVVAEERGVGRGFFAVERIEGRTVDEVDVKPAVVVVVDQADAGAVRFDDEVLLGHAHLVRPTGKACLFRDVLKDDRGFARLDEPTLGDGVVLLVVLSGSAQAAGDAAHLARSWLALRGGGLRLRRLCAAHDGKAKKEDESSRKNSAQARQL